MQRMQLLQQEQEEFSPEEMVTRFERERSERLLAQLGGVCRAWGGATLGLRSFVRCRL